MFYRNILKNALKVSWSHKYLWLLGLFAALMGNGGEYEIVLRGLGRDGGWFDWTGLGDSTATFGRLLADLPNAITNDPATMIKLFLVGVIAIGLALAIVWLVVISQGALVSNAAQALSGKKHSLADGLYLGVQSFWKLLALNLGLRIAAGLVIALLFWPIMSGVLNLASVAANALFGLAFIIFIPLLLTLSFVVKYAIAYAVIKGDNISAALAKGYHLFRENWLVSLEMAFLLFFINLVAGLAFAFVFLVLVVPFVFLALAFYSLASQAGFWFVVVAASVLAFGAIACFGAFLATFQTSAWVGLYSELVGRGGASKIVRILGKITN